MKFSKETKVGIFTVIVIIILVYFSFKIGKIGIFKPPTYTISTYFKSASGIGTGTVVTMAGIKIGRVSEIKLENGEARVYMNINSRYKVYPSYVASIQSMSLLGGNYISITPVHNYTNNSNNLIKENEVIKSIPPQDMSHLIRKFSNTASNLEKVAKSLRNTIGTKSGQKNIKATIASIAHLSENLNRLVYLNQKNFNIMMTNFAGFSKTLNSLTVRNNAALARTIRNFKDISDNLRQELPAITSNIKVISGNLKNVMVKNRHNINESLKNISKDSKKLQLTLNQIYGISSKINEGKGTIGKLVNKSSVYRNLNGSLKGVNAIVGGINSLKIKMDMSSEYLMYYSGSLSEVNVKLQPSPSYYLKIGVASTPMNYGNSFKETQTTTYTTNYPPSGQFYPPSVTTNTTQYTSSNAIKFNLEIARSFYNFTLLAGLMYSTGGIGVDYYVPGTSRNLKLYARAFGFSSGNGGASAHVNAGISYTFFRHLFINTGYDDIFSKYNKRSIFIGGGIKFSN